jgi:hypothetical protein
MDAPTPIIHEGYNANSNKSNNAERENEGFELGKKLKLNKEIIFSSLV